MGKVAFDAELDREMLMLGVFGSVIQRKGLTPCCRELFETTDDRPVGFSRPFSGELGDPHQPAFAFDQGIQGRFALAGDETIALPVTGAAAIINGLRPGIDRNPVGNLGFSCFSADALVSPLPMGSAKQFDHLQPVSILGMIDILIDGLVVDELPGMVDSYAPGDLLRRPTLLEADSYVPTDDIVFQSFVSICLGLSFTGPSMCPAGCIATSLWRTVSRKLTRDCAFVSANCLSYVSETETF